MSEMKSIVKPLEWHLLYGDQNFWPKRWQGAGAIGKVYVVEHAYPSDDFFSVGRKHPSLDDAKAASQDDYERRILSALSVEAVNSFQALKDDIAAKDARIAKLEAALKFYGDAWCFTASRTWSGLEWKPKEELLEDCGNIARAALRSTEVQDNG